MNYLNTFPITPHPDNINPHLLNHIHSLNIPYIIVNYPNFNYNNQIFSVASTRFHSITEFTNYLNNLITPLTKKIAILRLIEYIYTSNTIFFSFAIIESSIPQSTKPTEPIEPIPIYHCNNPILELELDYL